MLQRMARTLPEYPRGKRGWGPWERGSQREVGETQKWEIRRDGVGVESNVGEAGGNS
jgi:hypothetical protein